MSPQQHLLIRKLTMMTLVVIIPLLKYDEDLSSPPFIPSYLNYPDYFSISDYDDEEDEYLFGNICSKSHMKKGPKGMMSNVNMLPQAQGIIEIEDTIIEQAVEGRMFIEDNNMKVMLLLEQVDSENEEIDNKNDDKQKARIV
ncbi:hypothetical protein Leryth_008658 [Lithospermum erythrorhizon]|nr:hypothetical protein Leryth_008658 [Lithospermum erythrorhizon]